jgi:hypothetical protein
MAKSMNNEHRRLLGMLADNSAGFTERRLLMHGFRLKLISELIGKGFSTAMTERVIVAGHPIDVTRIMITDAGRVALEQAAAVRE